MRRLLDASRDLAFFRALSQQEQHLAETAAHDHWPLLFKSDGLRIGVIVEAAKQLAADCRATTARPLTGVTQQHSTADVAAAEQLLVRAGIEQPHARRYASRDPELARTAYGYWAKKEGVGPGLLVTYVKSAEAAELAGFRRIEVQAAGRTEVQWQAPTAAGPPGKSRFGATVIDWLDGGNSDT
jgi:hypothetical protein